VLDHDANDSILDFAVVQVDADFVAHLELAVWLFGWRARNLPSLRLVIHTNAKQKRGCQRAARSKMLSFASFEVSATIPGVVYNDLLRY
jgi:hypothetical protein